MQITAAMVKELRERTGSGMMECKKALQEAEGNIDTAIENMRKAGLAKADKKATRVAAHPDIAGDPAPLLRYHRLHGHRVRTLLGTQAHLALARRGN